jgi:hypothetical protein
MPAVGQLSDDRRHIVVAPGEAIVMDVLIVPITLEQECYFVLAGSEAAKLFDERGPDTANPLRVRRGSFLPTVERMASGAEEQLNGVDQGSVEIEENGGKRA